jgi:hypothetical protein
MDAEPLVRVVRGNPTAEELAALVTVVAGRASQRFVYADSHPGGSPWTRSARPSYRPRTWRESGLPGVVHRAL